MTNTFSKSLCAMALASLTTQAFAEVSADEAKQLGGPTLTVMGAEKAGNKDGTIPEYTGQPVKIPGYDPKEPGRRPDPFADEKPLLSITAQNTDKYADKLDAYVTIFKKYPNFRMDIYPTHRTVTLPKHVIDNTLKNATKCKTAEGEVVLVGCYGGIPFPIPKTGTQVMWNHLMAYEFYNGHTATQQFIIPNSGAPVLTNASKGVQQWPMFDPKRTTPGEGKDLYWKIRIDYVAPTRAVGEKLVVLDAFDSVHVGRRAYSYVPGQRRVKLAPDLAYDTPSPVQGGTYTMDDGKVFLGAVDRYDFKLIGKKEKYIPYNSFKTTDYKVCPLDKLAATRNFPNPDCVRWELHRVWVVEAKVKTGFRHIYKTRRFYWDEDGYAGGLAENYDASGNLYRIIQDIQYPFQDGGANASTTQGFDLQTGAYALQANTNFPGSEWGFWEEPAPPDNYFSPEALAGEGIR